MVPLRVQVPAERTPQVTLSRTKSAENPMTSPASRLLKISPQTNAASLEERFLWDRLSPPGLPLRMVEAFIRNTATPT